MNNPTKALILITVLLLLAYLVLLGWAMDTGPTWGEVWSELWN